MDGHQYGVRLPANNLLGLTEIYNHSLTYTYIYGIYNVQHGRAYSSNQRRGLLLGGSLGMEAMEEECF